MTQNFTVNNKKSHVFLHWRWEILIGITLISQDMRNTFYQCFISAPLQCGFFVNNVILDFDLVYNLCPEHRRVKEFTAENPSCRCQTFWLTGTVLKKCNIIRVCVGGNLSAWLLLVFSSYMRLAVVKRYLWLMTSYYCEYLLQLLAIDALPTHSQGSMHHSLWHGNTVWALAPGNAELCLSCCYSCFAP